MPLWMLWGWDIFWLWWNVIRPRRSIFRCQTKDLLQASTMNRHWVSKGLLAGWVHEHHVGVMLSQMGVQLMMRMVRIM